VTLRENFSVRFDPHAGILSPEHPHESALELPCKHFFIEIRDSFSDSTNPGSAVLGTKGFPMLFLRTLFGKNNLLQNREGLFSSRIFLFFQIIPIEDFY